MSEMSAEEQALQELWDLIRDTDNHLRTRGEMYAVVQWALRRERAAAEQARRALKKEISFAHRDFHEGCCGDDGGECSICGILDCPFDDALHYHHDGCPSEYAEEQIAKRRARLEEK